MSSGQPIHVEITESSGDELRPARTSKEQQRLAKTSWGQLRPGKSRRDQLRPVQVKLSETNSRHRRSAKSK